MNDNAAILMANECRSGRFMGSPTSVGVVARRPPALGIDPSSEHRDRDLPAAVSS
jgi:hypothetical protein